jgi:hypothetical protein
MVFLWPWQSITYVGICSGLKEFHTISYTAVFHVKHSVQAILLLQLGLPIGKKLVEILGSLLSIKPAKTSKQQ